MLRRVIVLLGLTLAFVVGTGAGTLVLAFVAYIVLQATAADWKEAGDAFALAGIHIRLLPLAPLFGVAYAWLERINLTADVIMAPVGDTWTIRYNGNALATDLTLRDAEVVAKRSADTLREHGYEFARVRVEKPGWRQED